MGLPILTTLWDARYLTICYAPLPKVRLGMSPKSSRANEAKSCVWALSIPDRLRHRPGELAEALEDAASSPCSYATHAYPDQPDGHLPSGGEIRNVTFTRTIRSSPCLRGGGDQTLVLGTGICLGGRDRS